MADEIIGSVGVEARLDYQDLSTDFEKAVSLAVAAGSTLAEAIQQALAVPDSTGVTDAFTQVGKAADMAAEQLSLFGAAEDAIPFANAAGQLNLFATELDQVTASESKAAAGAQQMGQSFGQATPFVDQLKNAFADLEKNWESFAGSVGQFIRAPLQTAGNAAQEFLLSIGPVGGAIAGLTVGAAALAGEIVGMVQAFGAAAEATGNLADRLNLTWTETRRLEEMGRIAGVSITSLGTASFRLAEALDESSKQGQKIRASLDAIGVSGNTSGELMKGFLQRLSEIPDATERIRVAHEVLGRSSQQLIPLIKNYDSLKAAVQQLGPAIGDDLAAELQKTDDAFDKLGIAWDRFKEQIAAAFAPLVGSIVDGLRTLITQMSQLAVETANTGRILAGLLPAGLLNGIAEFGSVLLKLNPIFAAFYGGIRTATELLQQFNAAVSYFASSPAKDMKQAIDNIDASLRGKLHQDLVTATTHTKAFMDEWGRSAATASLIDTLITTQEKLAGAVTVARAAYDKLNDAYRTGTPLANGHRVSQEEVARALANLTAATAAAATTTQTHADKTHGAVLALRTMQPAVQVLVDQLKLEEAGLNKTIDAAARYNSAMEGMFRETFKALTPLQFAAKQLDDFTKSLEKLVTEAPMLDISKPAKDSAEAMGQLSDSIKDASLVSLSHDPFATLTESAKYFGITTKGTFEEISLKSQDEYEKLKASGLATYDELSIAALKTAQDEINAAEAAGEMTRAEYDKTTAQIQADLATLEDTTKRTMGHNKDAITQVNQAITRDLAKGLTDLIFQTGKVGDAFKKMGMDVVDIIVNHVIGQAIKPLLGALDQVLAKIPGIGSVFGGAAAGGSGAAGGGGGAAGGAASAAGSALSGILGFATLGVQIVSGIVSGIQQAHMSSDLQKIEESTRYLKGYTGEQGDSILATSHIMRDTLYQILAALDGVVKINLDGKISTDEANQLVDNLLNGSLNFYQRTYDTFQKLLQATTSGFAQVVGQLHAIGKDLNPPLWKSLLGIGGGGGGIGGSIGGGIGSLAGGLLGSIVGLFTGGGTNWEALIEENTRTTKILIDQNLNTIAVQSVLQTGDLDDIKSTLWKIRDALTETKNGATAASSEASAVNVHLHNPRLGGGLTPGEVSAAFQEGINQARAAGAFRLGVFPV